MFGGVAILTFGCIAIAVFASVLRGRTVSLLPTALIALATVTAFSGLGTTIKNAITNLSGKSPTVSCFISNLGLKL